MLREFAAAKVNLFLDVLRKRPDGYHDLGTVFQTIDAGDTLSGELLTTPEITVRYNAPQEYPLEKDLVYLAAKLLQKELGVQKGASFYLEKTLPLSAGLGGGSADAAAALRLLNKLWGLSLSYSELESFGKTLGADVPFLVRGGTALAEGIGEKLTFEKSAEAVVLIATPRCGVPTKEAYAGVIPSGSSRWESFKQNWNASLDFEMYNKFEENVFPKYPEIKSLKRLLNENGGRALMSGSGASVFAIFETRNEAEKLLPRLAPLTRFLKVTRFKKSLES